MKMPMSPSSPMRRTVSRGKRASRSMAPAMGRSSFSAKSRATSWIILCSSVSSTFMRRSHASSFSPRLARRLACGSSTRLSSKDHLWKLFLQELLELLLERRGNLEEIAHDAEIRNLEDRRLGVLVDGADHLGGAHTRQVLDGARDAEAQIQLRRDGPPRLPDLEAVGPPARVDGRARSAHGRPQHLGQGFEDDEVLRSLETAAA